MWTKVLVAVIALVGSTMALGVGYSSYGGGGLGGGLSGGLGGGHGIGYSRQTIVSHAAPIAIKAAPIAIAQHAPIAIAQHAPIAIAQHAVGHKQVIDYVDAHPSYQFNYGVHDAHTGDVKEQTEHRDGDVVKGSYSLIEPDGTKRIVEYTADDHNGFNAIVHREHNVHPQVVQKVVAPIAYKSAPILSYHH